MSVELQFEKVHFLERQLQTTLADKDPEYVTLLLLTTAAETVFVTQEAEYLVENVFYNRLADRLLDEIPSGMLSEAVRENPTLSAVPGFGAALDAKFQTSDIARAFGIKPLALSQTLAAAAIAPFVETHLTVFRSACRRLGQVREGQLVFDALKKARKFKEDGLSEAFSTVLSFVPPERLPDARQCLHAFLEKHYGESRADEVLGAANFRESPVSQIVTSESFGRRG